VITRRKEGGNANAMLPQRKQRKQKAIKKQT
jgi:hypothetical protein